MGTRKRRAGWKLVLTLVPESTWRALKAECYRRGVWECDGVAEALEAWVREAGRARLADRGEIPEELEGKVEVGPSREVRALPGELF